MQRTLKRSPSPGHPSDPSLSAAVRRAGRGSGRPCPPTLFILALALGTAAPASAVTAINTSTTIDGTNSIADSVTIIGSAVVTVAAGGSISGPVNLIDNSTLNVSGGSIGSFVGANDSSTVNVTSGTIAGGLSLFNTSTGNVSGGTVTGDPAILVKGGTANITGGTVSGGAAGVRVDSGTANISGGTISGTDEGVRVRGGTANISGGSASGSVGVGVEGGTASISGGTVSGGVGVQIDSGILNITGGMVTGHKVRVYVTGGTASLTGGTLSGTNAGVLVTAGTLTVVGCNLILASESLTGNLADGTPLDTFASATAPGKLVLKNVSTSAPQLTCPPNLQLVADPGGCSTRVLLTPGAFDTCDPNPLVVGTRSDGQAVTAPYPLGTTYVTWTATNSSGLASPGCLQSIQVRPSSPVGADMNAVAVDGVATRKDQLTVRVGQQLTLQMLVRFTTGPWIDETNSANTVYSVIPAGGTFVTKNVWKAPASLVNKTITLYARHTIPCTQVGITDTVTVTIRP